MSICCDREWTLEALDNLLKNAGEYSESHGKIEVTWSASEMAVIVKITDHGAGIAAEELPKILIAFTVYIRLMHRQKESASDWHLPKRSSRNREAPSW